MKSRVYIKNKHFLANFISIAIILLLIILAFLLGCILGSVIHIIRMKVSGEDHVLALGPYLSMGVALAVLFGNQWIDWYLLVVLGM